MKQIWNTIIILALTVAAFTSHTAVMAVEKEAGATATLSATSFRELNSLDDRVAKLQSYLEAKNSPLAGTASHLVGEADRLGIDWRLVPAIAGTESYFGQHIPQNSYNAWGWAIFTGMQDGKHFDGWEDGVTIVSEGLKKNYVDRGLDTTEKMGPVYAADPSWSWKVNHFIDDIENFKPNKTDQLAVLL